MKLVATAATLAGTLLSATAAAAFVLPTDRATAGPRTFRSQLQTGTSALRSSVTQPPSSSSSSSDSSSSSSPEQMRKDIEALRLEALRRLDALSEKVHEYHVKADQKILRDIVAPKSPGLDKPQDKIAATTVSSTKVSGPDQAVDSVVDLLERTSPKDYTDGQQQQQSRTVPDKATLLDRTRWRLSLNVGREEGTWMPKTWGASGERLRMSLEFEFSDDPLMEWEDFLNGSKGSKTLKVVHNQLSIAPSMHEGSLQIRVGNGGWRIAPREGPHGTDLLRFYFDLEEEARHIGSDVYCPAGRVYLTCGYFPRKHHRDDGPGFASSPQTSIREHLQKEQRELSIRYEELLREQEEDNAPFFNWEKVRREKQLMGMRSELQKLSKRLQEARTREPERSLLRLSQDQEVGLTREGGACCKVHKGLAIEYHILGHFEVASIPNRDHSDYRELLP